jgi:hypothetical protein
MSTVNRSSRGPHTMGPRVTMNHAESNRPWLMWRHVEAFYEQVMQYSYASCSSLTLPRENGHLR